MSNAEYFSFIKPYASKASAQTGIPASVIMAQWALETAYGTSRIAKGHNNHGGIKWISGRSPYQDYQTGMYAGYNSMNNFVNDYVRVMSLSYYDKVRKATGLDELLKELDKSPYAEGKQYDSKIKWILKEYSLTSPPPGTNGEGKNIWYQEDKKRIDVINEAIYKVNNMEQEELIKYSAIGVGALMLIGYFKD